MRQRLYLMLMMCFALACLNACAAGAEMSARAYSGGAAYPQSPPADPMAAPSGDADYDGLAEEAEGEPAPRRESVGFAGMPAPPPPPPTNAAAPAQPAPAGAPGSNAAATKPEVPSEVAVMRGPILIYTAQITMAVFEVDASLAKLEDLARELGGFLAKRTDTSITIRVPVATFDRAVKRIEKSGDVLNRNVTAQDVTEEFRDVEIRLRNAKAVRDRLEQLLAKAAKVEESVLVERELERVTGEIERMSGRLKFLKDRAAFSTITVTFQPKRQEELSQGPFRLPVPWLYQLGLSRLLSL